MYLEVTPSGERFWRLKYRFNGRESSLFEIFGYGMVRKSENRLKKQYITLIFLFAC